MAYNVQGLAKLGNLIRWPEYLKEEIFSYCNKQPLGTGSSQNCWRII